MRGGMRRWTAGIVALLGIGGALLGAAWTEAGRAQGRAPGPGPVVDTPFGTLVHHPCWGCGNAVAVTEDAVWMGTAAAGLLRWERGGGDPAVWTRDEGLPGNAIRAMAAGEGSELWVATLEDSQLSLESSGRVARWDGAGWEVFGPAEGLPSRAAAALEMDGAGDLWAAYPGQVMRFDGGRWEAFASADGVPSGPVVDLARAPDGALWLGGADRIARFDGRRFQPIGPSAGLPRGQVTALAAGPGEELWVGLDHAGIGGGPLGLAHFDGARWSLLGLAEGLASASVRDLHVDELGRVWVAHEPALGRGLSLREAGRWTTMDTERSPGMPSSDVLALASRGGTLYAAGGSGGLGRREAGRWDALATAGPYALVPTALAAGPGGALWLGFATSGGGDHALQRRDDVGWTSWTRADGLPARTSQLVRPHALAVDRSDEAWAATMEGGLLRGRGGAWTELTEADGLSALPIRALDVDSARGRVWVGSSKGVQRWDGAAWQAVPRPGSPQDSDVRALRVAPGGEVWIGTALAGAARWDGAAWQPYRRTVGLADDSVFDIDVAPDGAVWFATYGGVSRFDGRGWKSWSDADGLPWGLATTVHVDARGTVWAGVSTARGVDELGLARYDGTGWDLLGPDDGLRSAAILDIASDSAGHVWIATLLGLAELIPEGAGGTPSPLPSRIPSPTPTPRPIATATAPVPGCVCSAARRAAPPAALAAALANPARVGGWREPRNPNRPPGPDNPLRECLSLRDPGVPYHPTFNGLLFRDGCR